MRSFAVLLLGLAACAGDDNSGDDTPVDCDVARADPQQHVDTFVVGLEHMGGSGMLDFKLMSAAPAPPARGNNTWVVQINSMNAGVVGAPLTGAMLKITPYMPAHMHGTGVPVEITPMGDPGQYQLSPVNLWMQGVWETTIRATLDTTSDSTVYRFCVD